MACLASAECRPDLPHPHQGLRCRGDGAFALADASSVNVGLAPLDDEASRRIFDQYPESLKGKHIFLLTSNTAMPRHSRTALDDAFQQANIQQAFDIYNTFGCRALQPAKYEERLLQRGILDQSVALGRDEVPRPAEKASFFDGGAHATENLSLLLDEQFLAGGYLADASLPAHRR